MRSQALLGHVALLLFSGTAIGADIDLFGPSTAFTTRYWDCCKPSCAWGDKGPFVSGKPVGTCDTSNKPISDINAGTGCNGGNAFACANQSPWAVNDTFSYGFVGAYLKGGQENSWCCSCYALEFTSGSVKGKKMIVQASNTDYEMPDQNIFTFGIPGGNTSYANACAIQYGINNSTFGTENEGLSSRSDCPNLPDPLQKGCLWRFDWFDDAAAPSVNYTRVVCPKELTDITGCSRTDESTFGAKANATNKPSSAVSGSFPSLSTVLAASMAALILLLV